MWEMWITGAVVLRCVDGSPELPHHPVSTFRDSFGRPTTPPRPASAPDGRGAMLDGTCMGRRNGAGRPTDLAMERRKDHHDGIWHTTTANTTTVAQAIAQGFAQRVTRRIDGMRGGGIDYGRAIGCGGGGGRRGN